MKPKVSIDKVKNTFNWIYAVEDENCVLSLNRLLLNRFDETGPESENVTKYYINDYIIHYNVSISYPCQQHHLCSHCCQPQPPFGNESDMVYIYIFICDKTIHLLDPYAYIQPHTKIDHIPHCIYRLLYANQSCRVVIPIG